MLRSFSIFKRIGAQFIGMSIHLGGSFDCDFTQKASIHLRSVENNSHLTKWPYFWFQYNKWIIKLLYLVSICFCILVTHNFSHKEYSILSHSTLIFEFVRCHNFSLHSNKLWICIQLNPFVDCELFPKVSISNYHMDLHNNKIELGN